MDLFRRLFGKSDEDMNDLESDAEDKTLPGSVLSTNSPRAPLKPAGATAELPPLPDSTEPLRPPMPSKLGQTTPLPMIPDGTTRPLTPEKAIASNNSPLSFGQSSDVGLVRTNNQDAAYSFFVTNRSVEERPDFGLFIVADGMGGHHDGEKASALTARVVAAQVNNHVYMPMLNPTQDPDRPTIIEALTQAVQRANAEVMLKVPEGGTTITAVAVLGDLAHIAHVGDSRAYLVTQDSIEQITRDHSLVQRLIELDQLTQEEANDHPQKNVLYRAIGQSETLEVDTLTRRLPHNSRVLICSDGLWSQMNSDEISAIVMELPPQEACDKLVALANTRGGTDNITAIVLKIPR